jgi:hypothetical protein
VKQATVKNSIRTTNAHRGRVLVLYNSWFLYAETTREHVEMFAQFSTHDVTCADVAILDFDIDLANFETIVFHYSLVIAAWFHDLADHRRQKIINARAIKMLFIQDEFRWLTSVTDAITELGISVVFTVQPDDTVKAAYQTHPHWKTPILQNVRFVSTLTGFVDERLVKRDVPPYEKRQLDVTYRARRLPFWVGRAGLEKYEIAAKFLKSAKQYKLKCDISTDESDRIYGEAWFDFTASSKATLGTEGSSGLVDFDGKLIPAVDEYCAANPDATFEEVEAKFFPGKDGLIKYRAISPRCFEAAALRTLMVMYKGEYSGVLEAGRHYVELKRDHSNIAEVVKIIKDPKEASKYIERAYSEIACSGKWTSRAFMGRFDQVVSEEIAKNRAIGALPGREPIPNFSQIIQKGATNGTASLIDEQLAYSRQTAEILDRIAARLNLSDLPMASGESQMVTQGNNVDQSEATLSSMTQSDNTSAPSPAFLLDDITAIQDERPMTTETPVDSSDNQLIASTEITPIVSPVKTPWTLSRIANGVARRVIPSGLRQSLAAQATHVGGQWDRLKRSYHYYLIPPEKRRPLS